MEARSHSLGHFTRRLVPSALLSGVLAAGALARDSGNCLQDVRPAGLAGWPHVSQIEDRGNLTVMALDGGYERGNTARRQEVSSAFFATHPDSYDFIVVFTTFEFPTGEAIAFYNGIANDTSGIGKPLFNYAPQFGSASGRLQGYIDMAALGRYTFAPTAPAYKVLLDTATHELMHRWVASIHYRKSDGVLSTDLLGQDGAHWSYFLDTDASVMYGADWRDRGDGTFESVDTRHRYGPLDLYLAGFAAAGEVRPFGLIRGGQGDATDLPRQGALTPGTLETIGVEQVVAAEGPREPDAAHAPKEFRAALVLLRRPGETVPAENLVGLEQFRSRLQQRFAQMTDGRATLRVATERSATAHAGLPEILHGSGGAGTPPGRTAAVAWLEAAQRADGRWEDRPGTAWRDTAAAYAALSELHSTFAGLPQARAWLGAHPAVNVDQSSARLASGQSDDQLPLLLAARREGRGWGALDGWTATPLDSATTIRSLVASGHSGDIPLEALQYLVGEQDADGGFGFVSGGRARVLATLRVADALGAAGATFADARSRAAHWLAGRQRADGSFGDFDSPSLTDTLEVFAAGERAAVGAQALEAARLFVASSQQVHGDWGGSVYATALAALANARDSLPNLVVAGNPSIQPVAARDGDHAVVSATVANAGRAGIPATTAQWYLGDPRAGGSPIGPPTLLPPLAGFEQTSISQRWDTFGLAGDRSVWLALDVMDAVAETSEDDNFSGVSFTVAPPGALPDLMLDPAEIAPDPPFLGALPATVHVRGTLHNSGLAAVPGAMLRLVVVRGAGDAVLAETSVDAEPRSSTPFDLSFTQSLPGTVRLAVIADPQRVVAEVDEDNNRAEVVLGAKPSIDPAVAPDDLSVGTATVGHDVPIHVVLHNFGTLDTPVTPLRVEVSQGGAHVTLFDGGMQIPAGASIARDFQWRPTAPGAATLSVDVDAPGAIAETDETNNHAERTFDVTLTASADLAVADGSLAFLPSPALEGAPMTASLRVRNNGNAAVGTFSVALFARDPSLGGAPLGSTSIAGLAPGEERMATIAVASTPGSGDERFYALVDADAQIAELDESNNVAVALLRVLALPDVAITVADIALTPSLPVPGEPVQASVTVHNLGGQPAEDVTVHFYEGAPHEGREIAPPQHVAALGPGASVDLDWNWTLGADARLVTAIAHTQGAVADANPSNDAAGMPFDVQGGDAFTSERYISPDGDGVRDAAVAVFRLPPGVAGRYVEVRNGVPRVVRRVDDVSARDDGRVQVLWDGRDDARKIVPDGDYRLVVRDADGNDLGQVVVTVDLNRSSPLEAVHTPYEVMARLPADVESWQRLPRGPGYGDAVVGIGRNGSAQAPAGLFRSDILIPRAQPVVTPRWIANYFQANAVSGSGVTAFGVSPDGATLVFLMRTHAASVDVFRARVDQVDTVHRIAANVPIGADSRAQVLFFDADEALIWSSGAAATAVDLRTDAIRAFPVQNAILRVTPEGVVTATRPEAPAAFLPRSGGSAVTLSDGSGDDGAFALSPDGRYVAAHRNHAGRESVSLIRVTDGSERVIRAIDAYALTYLGQSESFDRLQMAWLEVNDELLVGDASTGRILRIDADGQPLSTSAILPIPRNGDYAFNIDGTAGGALPTAPGGGEMERSHLYAVQTFREAGGVANGACRDASNWRNARSQRQFYDPAGDRVYFGTQESLGYVWDLSGTMLMSRVGIVDYQSSMLGGAEHERLSAVTLTPLAHPADQRDYPGVDGCGGTEPASWPRWLFADGGRVRADRRIETLAGGVRPEPWIDAENIVDAWPDETHLALGDPDDPALPFDRVFSSLLNEPAVLRATPLGRGIQLFGNATDRNFSSYRIDWTDADAPGTWHVVTPPSREQVFLDEFLTWVPPQPGRYLVRLTVADLAGNVATAMATAVSEDGSPIESLQVEPRWFSPNGDGEKDEAVARFVVREPASLAFELVDETGHVVRHVSQTYVESDLGPHEFRWNGRNDGGMLVPDGRYHFEVAGFGLWLTLDTRSPLLDAFLGPLKIDETGIASSIEIRSADVNLQSIVVESSVIDAAEWSQIRVIPPPSDAMLLPETLDDKAPTILRFDLSTYVGHEFRVVATDRAGNRVVYAVDAVQEQLIPYGVAQPDYWSDLTFEGPSAATVLVGQAPTGIMVADAVGGLTQVILETAAASDAPPPAEGWTVRAQQPAAYACGPHCLGGSNGRVFDLTWDLTAVPLGTSYWMRARGIRQDGHDVVSRLVRVDVVGIEPPENAAQPCIFANEYVPGPMAYARLYVTVGDTTRVFTNAAPRNGAIDFAVSGYPSGANGSAYVDAIGSDGRLYRSRIATNIRLDCATTGNTGGAVGAAGIQAYVVGHESCDATPTNHLEIDLPNAGSLTNARLGYRDPGDGGWKTLKDLQPGEVRVDLDTSAFPEGSLSMRLERDAGSGYETIAEKAVPIVHTPPIAQLDVPEDGARVCPLHDGRGAISIATEGRASSINGIGYRIESESAAVPGALYCSLEMDITNSRRKAPSPHCIPLGLHQSLDDPYRPGLKNYFGPLMPVGSPQLDVDEALTVRLKVGNWSGATACAANTIRVDSGVELVERRTPAPRLPARPPRWLAISAAGNPDFREAKLYLKAQEALDVRVRLAHAQRAPNGTWSAGDDQLRVLLDEHQLIGDFDVAWDGKDGSGNSLADGVYAIVLDAQDHCGNTKKSTYFAEVDSTPPDLAIGRPEPAQVVQSPVVPVTGQVIDANIERWALSIDAGQPALHQDVAAGQHGVQAGGALGVYARAGASGPATLHLTAQDALGNTSSVDRAFVLGDPVALIASMVVQPDLVSPNGDGRNDTARVATTLLRASLVDIDVRTGGGGIVRVLRHGEPLAAGSSSVTWDGRSDGGSAAGDGAYVVRLTARDAGNTAYSETAEVPVEIDSTAPAITIAAPATPIVAASAAVIADVGDRNLDRYRVALLKSDGRSVAAVEGTQGGSIYLTDLSDSAEGNYVVRVEANDRAGNRSSKERAFLLDRTLPDVALTNPADGSVLRGGRSVTVHGRVVDAHLATYSLAVAPAQSDAWTTIAEGTRAVEDGDVATWTPQLADGRYRLRLRGVDEAGNAADATAAVEIDSTPPTVVLGAPADGSFVGRSLVVSGTAGDTHFANYTLAIATPAQAQANQWSEIFRGDHAVDGGVLAGIDLVQADGDYVLRLAATDAVDLVSTVQARVSLDTAPPPAPLTLSVQLENNRDSVLQWAAVAATDLAGYAVYRDGVRLNPSLLGSTGCRDPDVPEGRHVYFVRAFDRAENGSAPSNSVEVLVDRTPPLALIATPASAARVHGVVDVVGTAYSRDDFKEYRLDVTPLVPPGPAQQIRRAPLTQQMQPLGAWDTRLFAEETRARIRLEAEDLHGNIAVASVEVTIDNAAPAAPTGLVAALAGADAGTHWNPNTESDLLGYLLYRDGRLVNAAGDVDGGDLRPFALVDVSYLDRDVPDGQHAYVVRAIDRAGNVSGPSEPATLAPIDNGPPHLAFLQPSNGARFEASITAIAVSEDRDIVEVRFAVRRVGDSDWTALGDPLSAPPYRVTFTPAGVPHGEFDIRAVATDATAHVDPDPPIVRVEYADLTSPGSPSDLRAHAEGRDIRLQWTASAATDVVGYDVWRRQHDGAWQRVNPSPVTGTDYVDADHDDGDFAYYVDATDAAGNASQPSNEAAAHVFTVRLRQPYSPVDVATFDLAGTSPRAGALRVRVEGPGGAVESDAGQTPSDGTLAVSAIPLATGTTRVTVSVTDADGNVGVPGEVWMDRGGAPSAPTGLGLVANDHEVGASWNPNPEGDVVGYRVFRDDRAVPADATGTFPLSASSDTCCGAAAAVDGNAQTAWEPNWLQASSSKDASITVMFDTARYVAGVQLDWTLDPPRRDLYAWSGHAWILLAHREGRSWGSEQLNPPGAYLTSRLKLVLGGVDGWNNARLTELKVVERALQPQTSRTENVIDGHHVYRVSAVNALGFESALGDPAGVDVGDAVPPDAVVLSGEIEGDEAHLSWTASSAPDTASYRLFRNGEWIASISSADPLEYVDGGLLNGTYAYSVRAYDAYDNEGEESNVVALTVARTLPGVPRIVAVDAPAEGGALVIRWEAGAGPAPDGYVLNRSQAEQGPYEFVDYIYDTHYRDQPLVDGTRYYYTVEAYDGYGDPSGPSAPASGVPGDRTVPEPPRLTFPTIAGTPLTTRAAAVAVCGVGEARATIGFERNAVPTGISHAGADTQVASYGFGLYYNAPPLPSPDGSRLFAASGQGSRLIAGTDGGTLASFDRGDIGAWDATGTALYTASSYGSAIVRRDLANGAVEDVEQPFTSITAFAVGADESTLLVAGNHGDGGNASGIWLYDRGTQAVHRLGTWSGFEIDARSLRFSPDGRRAMFLVDNWLVQLVDLETLAVEQIASDATTRPAWSPDGTRIAFARDVDAGESIWVHDVRTGATNAVAGIGARVGALAWRPDGDAFAVVADYSIRVHALQPDGSYALEQTVYPGIVANALDWTPAGRLFLLAADRLYATQFAGWFCSTAMALQPGANAIDAYATDAAHHTSLASLPIEIDRAVASLPDLSIAAADILFLPATGAPGDRFGAYATVRNRGGAAAAATSVQFDLVAPDGSTAHPAPVTPLHELAAGQAQSLSLDLGVLSQAGAYRLRAVVDPEYAVEDAERGNNEASASVRVIAGGLPTLTVGVSRTLYAPGETVRGAVDIVNPGGPFSGSVRVTSIDDTGAIVHDLGTTPVETLAFGAGWHQDVAWPPDVFAGGYGLRAELRDRAGTPVASATAPFAIDVSRTFDLRLQPERVDPGTNQPLALATDLAFLAGNAPLQNAHLHWLVRDGAGAVAWSADQVLGTLLPGYALHRDIVWPGAADAGVYRVEVHLLAPAIDQVAGADIVVQAATAGGALAGTIDFEPGAPFVAGRSMRVRYHASNAGQAALAGAQLRLRVIGAPSQPALMQRVDTVDLAAGQSIDAALDPTMPPLALGSYAAVLDAHLDGDAAGTWRPLAQAGFAVVDGVPPDIALLQPDSGLVQPAVVPLAARIVDRDSAVAGAEVSVDGGGFQPLALRADGTWGRGMTGLGDGAHHLAVRARDAWGNAAQTGELAFAVDATPPRIDVSGVADGETANHALVPIVTIGDDHLAASEMFLGGQPFVSGTTLEQDGDYVLTVRASDAAGNGSARVVRFAIDRTAPPVAIVDPVDGTTTSAAGIAVTVQSEPAAHVRVATGAYAAEMSADADGLAYFDAVPMAIGDNAISAVARDAAGNESGPARIVVHCDTGPTTTIGGTLQPPGPQVGAGEALRVGVSATNPNAVALPAQTMRVRVLSTSQQVLGEQSLSHAFAADETWAATVEFTTAGWALGTLSIELALDAGGGAFTLLDVKSVDLVDRTPPQLVAVAPAADALVRSPVVLRATADDALGAVASVEARIDGGDWLPLAPDAPPAYAGEPQAIADGEHAWSLRAKDAAGNEADVGPIAFVADSTPPTIAIGGVADGDVVAHSVTPTIVVDDLHPGTDDVRLNGQPFVSGTPVAASGDYALTVDAVDAAGNEGSASVHFVVDLDVPAILYTNPAEGAVVDVPSITVAGDTEAGASVHLAADAFGVDVLAEADGRFTVPDVPLLQGFNTIAAQATDRAGNVGPMATLHVTYQPPPSSPLVGSLGVAATVEQGASLDVAYALHNPGDAPIHAQAIRVELRSPADEDVIEAHAFVVDVDAHQTYGASTLLATAEVPVGDYRVLLLASSPIGDGDWSVLDTAYVGVTPPRCHSVRDRIFADGFDRGRGDRIFCDGFERDAALVATAIATALPAGLARLVDGVLAVGRSLGMSLPPHAPQPAIASKSGSALRREGPAPARKSADSVGPYATAMSAKVHSGGAG